MRFTSVTLHTLTCLHRVPVGQTELLTPPHGVFLLLRGVEGDITALLLNRPDDLPLCRSVQVVPRLPQEQLQMIRDVSAMRRWQ